LANFPVAYCGLKIITSLALRFPDFQRWKKEGLMLIINATGVPQLAYACDRTVLSAVSLRLPDDISERLEHLSKKTGRTKTFYMIQAIKEHLDNLEGLYLAEQSLIENRAGRSKTYTLNLQLSITSQNGGHFTRLQRFFFISLS
jgi:RHH-type rel operon transcriptional repressor/antitoxin RelB